MATGTVKWFSDDKGFGFIAPDEQGNDLFVHHSAIAGGGFKTLAEGAKVEYDEEQGPKGPRATNVPTIGADSSGTSPAAGHQQSQAAGHVDSAPRVARAGLRLGRHAAARRRYVAGAWDHLCAVKRWQVCRPIRLGSLGRRTPDSGAASRWRSSARLTRRWSGCGRCWAIIGSRVRGC